MIPGTCPDCGTSRPLADYLADAEARAALAAALDLPPALARQIVAYIGLHAPAGKRIAVPKLARLLRELAQLIPSGEVARRGIVHPAPQSLWCAAFDAVLAARDAGSLSLPLDGHGYLTEIAWRLAGQAAERPSRPIAPPATPSEAAERRERLVDLSGEHQRLSRLIALGSATDADREALAGVTEHLRLAGIDPERKRRPKPPRAGGPVSVAELVKSTKPPPERAP